MCSHCMPMICLCHGVLEVTFCKKSANSWTQQKEMDVRNFHPKPEEHKHSACPPATFRKPSAHVETFKVEQRQALVV